MRYLNTFFAILAIALATPAFPASAAAPGFTFLETPGSHAVGFRVVEQYDNARSFGEGAWPLSSASRGAASPT